MSVPLAVLEWTDGAAIVRTPEASWRITRPIAGLDDLAALARKLDTHQLWLHPSWSIANPDVQLCEACAEPRAADGTRRRHRHWLTLDKAPNPTPGTSSVAHPQLAIVHGDPQLRALAEASDGRELLALLARVCGLLGTYWRGTPGATGVALLREFLHRAGHALEALPAPVRAFPPEPDFGWQRPLTAAEARRKWLYCFDKHNMYLVASGTVGLGVGAIEFKAEPGFHARQPGYWHCKLSPWPADHPLPDPTRGAGPPRDPEALRWLTTPSVEAAISAGTLEYIAAAWYWPLHGTYLQALGKLIRGALQTCALKAAHGDRPAYLTREVLKAVYAELLSGYLARNALADTDDPLYRPDWRDALKAEARTRLWYSLRPLASAGLAPVAIATDAIYVPSDADNPAEVLDGLLVLGAMPRQWAYKRRVALADVADTLEGPVGTCRYLTARVRALAAV